MRVSIVVPTYRRAVDLSRCLAAIRDQLRVPDEVVVVYREQDDSTSSVLRQWSQEPAPYKKLLVPVCKPGQVHALRQGCRACSGDIVAFTDDDAIPRKDWLRRILQHYENQRVGGVGGRDVIHDGNQYPQGDRPVGTLTWYGRLLGNHHLGAGEARKVDVLKGVNMSFRRELIEFPEFLRGKGAQIHNEVGLCLHIRRKGFLLIYDPKVLVDHYPGCTFDGDRRRDFLPEAVREAAFNQSVATLMWLPWQKKIVRHGYQFFVGDRGAPGILRFLTGLLRKDRKIVRSYIPTLIGQLQGFAYFLRISAQRYRKFG